MPLRVLVADDDTDLGQLIARYLTRSGYHADAVTSAREAIASAVPYDVFVIDVGIDGSRGVDVAKAVCAASPTARVIFISGHPFDVSGFGEHSPRVAFLLKPFQPARLLESVRAAESGR